MTPRQRLLASIRGEETDRPAFSPFLAYYFEELPKAVQEKGELAYLQEMGADPLLRGKISAFGQKNSLCSAEWKHSGTKRSVTYKTPRGDLYAEYTYGTTGNTWYLTKHPVEDEEDLLRLLEWQKDLEIIPRPEAVNDPVRALGEAGLYLPLLGPGIKSSFQSMVEYWCGTVNLVYLCADNPDLVHEVVDIMREKSRRTAEISAGCEQEVFYSFEDSSTGNVSPAMYREYIAPEISEWCDILHNSGKLYIQHACGLLKNLLIPMADQGIDGIESITPPDTGDVTMEEAQAILPKHVSLIGGIEPVFLLNSTTDELVKESKRLIHLTSGRGYVLANSDSCPPGVSYEKFTALSRLVRNMSGQPSNRGSR